MRRIAFVASLLLLATACPKIERTVYRFDLVARTGEAEFVNITTDDPEKANNDFLDVVAQVMDGTNLEEKHPGWHITSKEFTSTPDGKLGGLVKFTFDDPASIGVYKHDKKSPYIWCAAPGSETLVSTNGKRIDQVLAGCVAWDKKATKLEVAVREGEMYGTEVSLLPQYEKWKAGETLERTPDAGFDFGGALQQLQDAAQPPE